MRDSIPQILTLLREKGDLYPLSDTSENLDIISILK
jgi:hypothetical protein